MKTPIWAKDANPSIDRPLKFLKPDDLNFALGTRSAVMIGKHRAQYTVDRRSYTQSRRSPEVGYDIECKAGRDLLWYVANQSGIGPGCPNWQMRG